MNINVGNNFNNIPKIGPGSYISERNNLPYRYALNKDYSDSFQLQNKNVEVEKESPVNNPSEIKINLPGKNGKPSVPVKITELNHLDDKIDDSLRAFTKDDRYRCESDPGQKDIFIAVESDNNSKKLEDRIISLAQITQFPASDEDLLPLSQIRFFFGAKDAKLKGADECLLYKICKIAKESKIDHIEGGFFTCEQNYFNKMELLKPSSDGKKPIDEDRFAMYGGEIDRDCKESDKDYYFTIECTDYDEIINRFEKKYINPSPDNTSTDSTQCEDSPGNTSTEDTQCEDSPEDTPPPAPPAKPRHKKEKSFLKKLWDIFPEGPGYGGPVC